MDLIMLKPGAAEVKGESLIEYDGKKEWIELLTLSHGMSQQITTDVSNTARTSGKPNFQDITCVKYMGFSSPKLYEYCLGAIPLDKASKDNKPTLILMARNDNDKIIPIMQYELWDTLISSISMQANPGDMPTETFTLNCTAIRWSFTKQGIDLQNEGVTASSWNIAKDTRKVA